jgi:hypothetical protein
VLAVIDPALNRRSTRRTDGTDPLSGGAPAGYDIVLSYSRADTNAGNALRDRLVDDGKLTVFVDWGALLAGRAWQPALEAALTGCRAMLVLIGPKGIGGWQHREIQRGLDRQTGGERTRPRSRSSPSCCPAWSPTTTRSALLALNT